MIVKPRLRLKKSEMLRIRVDLNLKAGLQSVAGLEGLDLSDIVRRACRQHIQQFQAKNG